MSISGGTNKEGDCIRNKIIHETNNLCDFGHNIKQLTSDGAHKKTLNITWDMTTNIGHALGSVVEY